MLSRCCTSCMQKQFGFKLSWTIVASTTQLSWSCHGQARAAQAQGWDTRSKRGRLTEGVTSKSPMRPHSHHAMQCHHFDRTKRAHQSTQGVRLREKAPFTPGVDAPRVQTSRRDA